MLACLIPWLCRLRTSKCHVPGRRETHSQSGNEASCVASLQTKPQTFAPPSHKSTFPFEVKWSCTEKCSPSVTVVHHKLSAIQSALLLHMRLSKVQKKQMREACWAHQLILPIAHYYYFIFMHCNKNVAMSSSEHLALSSAVCIINIR